MFELTVPDLYCTNKRERFQVTHHRHPATPAIARLGIHPWEWIDDCNRGYINTNGTAYPQSIGLAATFRYFIMAKGPYSIGENSCKIFPINTDLLFVALAAN